VKALIRAELLKLRTTRMLPWLLLATLALVVVTVAANISSADAGDPALPLHDPALLGQVIGITFGIPQVLVTVLGALAFTQEVRYGSITSTFLVEPRRLRILVAKAVALAVVTVAIAAATLVVAVALGVVLISAKDGNITIGRQFWQVVAAVVVAMALYGLFGLALGALLRDQVIAVIATLVWLGPAEHLLIDVLPEIGRWTPGGATFGLLQLGPAIARHGALLDAPVGGLLLVGYTAAVTGLAFIVAPRRDVL
jgi:ABC-type transport system involved in multi-copper enzyme maturation permease subunit